MRGRKWWLRELERREEVPFWPFFWSAPRTQVEAVIMEALRVRRNVVR
ncbi:hypothetical protein [Nisaea sp.]